MDINTNIKKIHYIVNKEERNNGEKPGEGKMVWHNLVKH